MESGTFTPMNRSKVPDGIRVFGAPFIDELKLASNSTRQKRRLVEENYSDFEARNIATKDPTIQCSWQRAMMYLEDYLRHTIPSTRDITHAYVQRGTALERNVFLSPTKEMNLPQTRN